MSNYIDFCKCSINIHVNGVIGGERTEQAALHPTVIDRQWRCMCFFAVLARSFIDHYAVDRATVLSPAPAVSKLRRSHLSDVNFPRRFDTTHRPTSEPRAHPQLQATPAVFVFPI